MSLPFFLSFFIGSRGLSYVLSFFINALLFTDKKNLKGINIFYRL